MRKTWGRSALTKYVTRRLRIADREFYFVGESEWIPYILDEGVLGDHARWMLDMQRKHRKPWHWWQPIPEPVVDISELPPTRWYDDVLGFLGALYALSCAILHGNALRSR